MTAALGVEQALVAFLYEDSTRQRIDWLVTHGWPATETRELAARLSALASPPGATVAWMIQPGNRPDCVAIFTDERLVAEQRIKHGWLVTPLYASPSSPPAQEGKEPLSDVQARIQGSLATTGHASAEDIHRVLGDPHKNGADRWNSLQIGPSEKQQRARSLESAERELAGIDGMVKAALNPSVGEKERERLGGSALIKLSLALDMLKTCVAVPFTADERDKCAFYIREGYNALRQADAPVGWVSVKECLPKVGNLRYLVSDGKVWRTAWFHSVGERPWWDCHGQQIVVTHWHHLPPLPATPRPAGSAE